MKALGITGSHRKDSNSGLLVKRVLDTLSNDGWDTEFTELYDKKLGFCTDCGYCKEKPECVIEDDLNKIISAMDEADAIIVGTPTYFGGVSGRLRVLFDRTLPLRRNGIRLAGKLGCAIAVGGSRNGGQEFTISDIHRWMLIHEMTVVGDSTTAHFGGISTGRNPGDSLNDEAGLKTVDNLAVRIKKEMNRRRG